MQTKIKPVEIDREDDDEATYRVGNATIHIVKDPDPLNPRTDWDNPWEWYSNHKRYSFDCNEAKRLNIDDIFTDDSDEEDHGDESLCEAILRQNPDFLDARPIYLLDHSGLSVSLGSFNDPWDSGVGAIAVITKKKAEEYWPNLKGDDEKLKKRAYEDLEHEVETFDKYLRGDVYGYMIHSDDGEGESCFGFYDIKDALEEGAACVSVKDATSRILGGLDIINLMNEKQRTHFSKVSWTDEAKDGEKLYTVSVSLESGCEHTETYGNPDVLAKQLGYQRGEFDGHSLLVWNETEAETETEAESEENPLDSEGSNG